MPSTPRTPKTPSTPPKPHPTAHLSCPE